MPRQFANLLDHPLRMRYRDPIETLGNLGFTAGMTVLDLGCGTGTFTTEMARMVGPTGTIHAVDLQPSLLAKAADRVQQAALPTPVHFHHSGAYALPLEPNSVDLAIVIATLPQIPNPQLALSELRRVIKPEGRLAISEELPDPAYVLPQVTRRQAEAAGFTFVQQHGTPFCYTQIFVIEKDMTIVEGVATVISA
jgi:ubiquinone/menaquinone biosynthesis C-methylase UbiE